MATKNKDSHNLTPKQEKFCIYYFDCGNASEAYRMAYNTENMKPESVWRTANELLNNPKVTSRLEELKEGQKRKYENRRGCVENVLMNIVVSDPGQMFYTNPISGKLMIKDPQQLPKELRMALKGIKNNRGSVSYTFNGKTEAARLLAQMNGWISPTEVNVKNENAENQTELSFGFCEDE